MAVVEFAQWQASASPTARRLREGAGLLSAMLPSGTPVAVPVMEATGVTGEGVHHVDVLAANLAAARVAVAQAGGGPLITVGGDCGVDLAPVEAAHRRHGAGLAVVWFDAHADLNTPRSSPSGAFNGMVLRTLLGEGPSGLLPENPLAPSQVVLAGTRDLDRGEIDCIDARGISVVPPEQVARPDAVGDAVRAGTTAVHLHVDLDVLDPDIVGSVGTPVPGGLTADELLSSVAALAARFAVAGLTIAEYQPTDSRDQDLLTGLVPKLVCSAGLA
ncbi:arginase family protein [Saccharopolyspora sp. CA-218241]|uniref:arginase family protein n=1 Tax=Saccharopolyspora sp. CA-218241 TaxID=3240027 RepID=UPI003D963642